DSGLIECLMTMSWMWALRWRADDVQEWRRVLPGLGNPSQRVSESRTRDGQQNSGPAVDTSIGTGHECRSQFMGRHDQTRSGVAEGLKQHLVGAARQSKSHSGIAALECASYR